MRRKQGDGVIDDGIKERLWIPGTAGEHTIVGAPVIELSPEGANSSRGCMLWRRQQKSVDEREDSYCGAFLREDFLPVAQQKNHGFKQVHGGLVKEEWDSGI